MVALTTFTSTTDVEELIPVEEIDGFVYDLERPLPLALRLVHVRSCNGLVPVRFPRWNALSGAPAERAGGETDIFVDVDITTTESSLTAAFRGFRLPFPDEISKSSPVIGVEAGAVMQAFKDFDDLIDTDILSVTTSATQSTGAVTDEYNIARFQADKLTYKALNLPAAQPVLLMSQEGYSELETSIMSSGATLQDGGLDLGPNSGVKGTFRGFWVVETANIASESTGSSGIMMPIGREGGIGIVVDEMPNARPTRSTEGEQRATDFVVLRAMYGVGLINPRRVLEVLMA